MQSTEGEVVQDGRPYRHKKTGHRYWFICQGIDCTNSRDGVKVALYQSERRNAAIFVRELSEFLDKFEEVME